MKKFFILGSNKTLSALEIFNLYGNSFFCLEGQFLIKEENLESSKLQETLGGTQKIGSIIESFPSISECKKNLFSLIESLAIEKEKRLTFGISFYGNTDIYLLNKTKKKIKGIIKNFSKKPPRFLDNKTFDLSSATLKKNKVIEEGFELCFLFSKERVYIGKTESVQDIDFMTEKDFGRPERNLKKGTIQPKLARILINIGSKKDDFVLDPFCGSGTIIQEGLLSGRKMFGSDIDLNQIDLSRKNLGWLAEKFPNRNFEFELFQHDTRKKFQEKFQKFFNSVITEPFLGKQLEKDIDYKKFREKSFTLSNLYLKSFRNFKEIIKPGGKIVFIFPIIKVSGKFYTLNLERKIEKLGFKILQIPKILKEKFPKEQTQNGIAFGRNDQFVKKEIMIFEVL